MNPDRSPSVFDTTPVICEHCDTVHGRTRIEVHQIARCTRCGAELYRGRYFRLDTLVALTLASFIVFIIANVYPVMTLEIQGLRSSTTLLQAILASYDNGIGPIAVAVALCVFLFPLLQIALFAWVLLPLRAGNLPPAFPGAMHALQQNGPWSMVEVFLLGMLVAVVKLASMAQVTPDTGLWAFAALTCMLTALNAVDLHRLWERAAEFGA